MVTSTVSAAVEFTAIEERLPDAITPWETIRSNIDWQDREIVSKRASVILKTPIVGLRLARNVFVRKSRALVTLSSLFAIVLTSVAS